MSIVIHHREDGWHLVVMPPDVAETKAVTVATPTSACEPNGIGPFAASYVEGGTWFEVAHFGDESAIRFTAPHLFDICVPLVPFGVVSTNSFEVRLMGTSKVVTVRFGMIGRTGHGPRVCLANHWSTDRA
jgi:hypothetical protein